MKRLWIGALLLSMLAILYVAAHRRRLAVEATLVDLRARRETLLSEARQANRHRLADVQAVAAAAPDARPVALAWRGPFGKLAADPKLQADYFAARRANLAFIYGPLFRAFHLSPNQVARLEDLIVRHDEEFFDTVCTTPEALHQEMFFGFSPFVRQNFALSAAGEWGDVAPTSEDEATALDFLARSDAEFQSQVAALAGPSSYDELQRYQAGLQYRDRVDQLGAAMAASGTPLTDAQADALAQVVAQSKAIFADGVDLNQALAGAAKVLSPEQFDVLQAQLAPAQTSNALYQAILKDGGFGTLAKLAAPLIPSPPLR